MATPDPQTVGRDLSLVRSVAVVTVISLLGSWVALATDLNASWWDAVGPTGRLSVPLPMNAALVLLALVSASGSRPGPVRVAAWLVALATTVAVVSGVFDGGYAADLTTSQRLVQIALVLSLVVTAGVAVRLAVRSRPRH